MSRFHAVALALLFAGCDREATGISDARDLSPAPAFDLAVVDAPPAFDFGCVQAFGSGLAVGFGRIDGVLTAVDGPTDLRCPHDDNHVRLQVLMNGAIYDVWVNVESTLTPTAPEVAVLQKAATLAGTPWQEGWHTVGVDLDYVTTLGVSSTAFTPMVKTALVAYLKSELQVGYPISVYMTGFGPTGGHDVHRNVTAEDGAVVTDPRANPRYYLFHFPNQSF
jgi:hypothetical protein